MLYLHVGLPKTGSTFLQDELFPVLPQVNYVGRPDYNLLERRNAYDKTTLSRFFDRSPCVWSGHGDDLLENLQTEDEFNADKKQLISDENALTGGINDPYRIGEHIKRISILTEKRSLSPLKVLIVIRRQDTWFASAYAETSYRYVGASQPHWESWIDERLSKSHSYYAGPAVKLKYNTLYSEIEKNIGQSNICMLPYEMLKRNQHEFYENILEFFGVKSNKNNFIKEIEKSKKKNVSKISDNSWSLGEASSWRSKEVVFRPGRLFSSLNLPRGVCLWYDDNKRDDKIELTDQISSRIKKEYSDENARIDNRLSVNLKKYGYY